jgi:hypothetical protein
MSEPSFVASCARATGTGFDIISRTRILSWQQDMPVTAYGVMDKARFDPHPDGYFFLECRAATGARQWASPSGEISGLRTLRSAAF